MNALHLIDPGVQLAPHVQGDVEQQEQEVGDTQAGQEEASVENIIGMCVDMSRDK